MADQDDDWQNFLNSVQEDPEDVETEESEDETPEADDDEVEEPADKSKKAKKESGKPKVDDDESDDEPEEDEETEEEPEAEDDKKPKASAYQPRLKQFQNEDGSLNAERIEKSYIENSKETVRVKKQAEALEVENNQLLEAINAKPEVAKALFGEEGAKKLQQQLQQKGKTSAPSTDSLDAHPLIRDLNAKMNKSQRKEYEDFVELNPEAVTDPEKARKIGKFLPHFSALYQEENDGEIPSMKEGLEAAYRHYGWDQNIKKTEEVAVAAKRSAATRSTSNSKKPANKKKITDQESFFAKKLGVKL